MTFGHDGSFGRDTVERLVRACRPGWRLDAFRPAGEGTDAVYFVSARAPDGTREAVLKAREFVSQAAFRPEPELLRLFEPTPVPVPAVHGVVREERPDLPTPCFLMERRDGRTVAVSDLSPAALERLAREAGRHLAHVHGTGSFRRFGPVRLRRDTTRQHAAVTVDGADLVVGSDGTERWRDAVAAMVDDRLANVEERFADLRADLRAFVEPRLDSVEGRFAPALVHHDYRPGNLLVDPGTGETRAVLDWGNAFTSEPAFNLVSTEQYLCARVPPGHPRRERVRAAIRSGYAEVADPPALPPRRLELYLAVTHLPALGWFSEWHAGATDEVRERDAELYREFVDALL